MRFPIQLVFFYQIKIRRLPRAMYPSRQLNRPPDHPRDCETYQHRPPCHGGHDYVVKCQRGGRRCGATLRFRPISAEIGCRRADLGRNQSKAPPPPPRRRQRDHPPNANTLSDSNALRDWLGGAAAACNGFVKVDVLMYTYVYLFLLDKEISRTHNHAKPEYRYGSKKNHRLKPRIASHTQGQVQAHIFVFNSSACQSHGFFQNVSQDNTETWKYALAVKQNCMSHRQIYAEKLLPYFRDSKIVWENGLEA